MRKTYKEKLKPTPAQERVLGNVLHCCRVLYNSALEQRVTWWRCGHGKYATRLQHEAELREVWGALPDSAAIHSHVLQDVLVRLATTYQAFFRRLAAGARPGFPRFQGKGRYHSFTYREFGNGVHVDNGILVLSKIGRIAAGWSRPLQGTPKTVTSSQEAEGWYVSFSCAEVPTEPLPITGRTPGIDVGLKVFLARADGVPSRIPDPFARPRNAWPKPSGACLDARKAAILTLHAGQGPMDSQATHSLTAHGSASRACPAPLGR